MYISTNPFDQAELAKFEIISDQTLAQKLELAAHAAKSLMPIAERADVMRRAARLLEGRKEHLARLMALEMGKPLAQGRAEIEKCGRACLYFAENAETMLQSEAMPLGYAQGQVRFEPLGVLLGIMPWNYPFWQVFRFAAPAFMVGNAVLVKHASNVPQCALAIEQLLGEAGSPEGAYQNIFADNDQVARLIADRRVRGVSLTGSAQAGARVAALSGQHLKKSVLELGGSDAFVVLEDADLTQAAQMGAQSRLSNAGQACIAAKRFVVLNAVYDEFRERLVAELQSYPMGNPLDPGVLLGPMARPDLVESLERQVRESIRAGAHLVLDGGRMPGPGNFFSPMLLENVPEKAPAYGEELFGPAASLFRVPDQEAALALANDSDFGLGASIWTGDTERGLALAGRLEAGTVAINAIVHSDPRMPFGGSKDSGYGRELSGYGLKEFVNVKAVLLSV